jgi:YD repeat-containing protein
MIFSYTLSPVIAEASEIRNNKSIETKEKKISTDRFIVTYKEGKEDIGKEKIEKSIKNNIKDIKEITNNKEVNNPQNTSKFSMDKLSTVVKAVTKFKRGKKKSVDVIEIKKEMNKEEILEKLKDNEEYIESIQPDYKVHLTTNDTHFNEQWPLKEDNNNGHINLLPAWEVTQGENTVVGIIDTGIDINHEDLKDNIWVNIYEIPNNGIDDDNNGYVDDTKGWNFYEDNNVVYNKKSPTKERHGTHIGGIIAAKRDNNKGITGVAPKAKIMPLKAFNGQEAYTSDIIRAIKYAQSMGVKVINCSWAGENENPILRETIKNSKILFVCAAGNEGENIDVIPTYPASYNLDNVISVGSINRYGQLSHNSNYGESNVHIGAPGEDILSTLPNNQYSNMSGTSMAAPFVSGQAALIFSNNKDISTKETKNKIISYSDKLQFLLGKIYNGSKVNCNNALRGKIDKEETENKEDLRNNDKYVDEVIDIFRNVESFDDLSEQQKRKILEYTLGTEEELKILFKIQSKKLVRDIVAFNIMCDLKLSQILEVIKYKNNPKKALIRLVDYYEKIVKNNIILDESEKLKFINSDFKMDDIMTASVVANFTNIPLEDIIRQIVISDFDRYGEYESKFLKRYYVQPETIKEYIIKNNITYEKLYKIINEFELNIRSGEDTLKISSYSDSRDEVLSYLKDLNSPFSINANSNENIDPSLGRLKYTKELVSLPGKSGLNFKLNLIYDSNQANIDRNVPNVKTYMKEWWGYLYYYNINGEIRRSFSGLYREDTKLLAQVNENAYNWYKISQNNIQDIREIPIKKLESQTGDNIEVYGYIPFTFDKSKYFLFYKYWNGWKYCYSYDTSKRSRKNYKLSVGGTESEQIRSINMANSGAKEYDTKFGREISNKYPIPHKDYKHISRYGKIIMAPLLKFSYNPNKSFYWIKYHFDSTINVFENYKEEDTYLEKKYGLGPGWALGLPSIEIDTAYKSDTKYMYLHLGNGMRYPLKEYEDSSGKLKLDFEYEYQDLKVEIDKKGAYKNDTGVSKYILSYLDGKKAYFDEYGNLLAITSKYYNDTNGINNKIDFKYKKVDNVYVLDRIIDSYGRRIQIQLSNNGGNKVTKIGVYDSEKKQYVSSVELTSSYIKNSSVKTLKSIRDSEENIIYFDEYELKDAKFGYESRLHDDEMDFTNTYALLKKIKYPTKAYSYYTYEKDTGNFGEKGLKEYFRIETRKDVDDNKNYNVEEYIYNNNYTGYPLNENPESLPKSFEYMTTVRYVNKLEKELERKLTFNNKNLLVKEEYVVKGTVKKSITREYNRLQLKKETINTYAKDGSYTTSEKQYRYNDYKQLEEFTDELGHTTNVTYQPENQYLVKSQNIPIDAGKNCIITYNISNDKKYNKSKNITYKTVDNQTKNLKVEYTNNPDGTLNNSILTMEDGKPIKTSYNYEHNIPNSEGKKVNRVTITGNVTHVNWDNKKAISENKQNVVEKFEYDYNTGNLIKYINPNNKFENYIYDKLGRLTEYINFDKTKKTIAYDVDCQVKLGSFQC